MQAHELVSNINSAIESEDADAIEYTSNAVWNLPDAVFPCDADVPEGYIFRVCADGSVVSSIDDWGDEYDYEAHSSLSAAFEALAEEDE